jgi:2,4-dienoyl-CoA reductase-like NADH-dependent reductase (Old Yellow Enzyme family)
MQRKKVHISLFSLTKPGAMRLKNRIVTAYLMQCRIANTGHVSTELMARHYAQGSETRHIDYPSLNQ